MTGEPSPYRYHMQHERRVAENLNIVVRRPGGRNRVHAIAVERLPTLGVQLLEILVPGEYVAGSCGPKGESCLQREYESGRHYDAEEPPGGERQSLCPTLSETRSEVSSHTIALRDCGLRNRLQMLLPVFASTGCNTSTIDGSMLFTIPAGTQTN
jgi:hypothetical protein